jgi:transcriptional regulator with XRE-family HTH domain
MGKASRRKPARLAGKLLEIRLKLELSQNQLIKRLGLEDELEQQYISKFEHGVIEPPLHVLCAYADLVDVPLDSLARDYLDLPKVTHTKSKRIRPAIIPRSRKG